MNTKIRASITEETKRLDEIYLATGDVLDVKASIILVVVTFLGTLSGQILTLHDLPFTIKIIQVASVLALGVVSVLIISCLWVKQFKLPPDPELWVNWVSKVEEAKKAGEVSSQVEEVFEVEQEKRTRERIVLNGELASKKSKLLKWSFWTISVAVGLEFICLLWLAWWRL